MVTSATNTARLVHAVPVLGVALLPAAGAKVGATVGALVAVALGEVALGITAVGAVVAGATLVAVDSVLVVGLNSMVGAAAGVKEGCKGVLVSAGLVEAGLLQAVTTNASASSRPAKNVDLRLFITLFLSK